MSHPGLLLLREECVQLGLDLLVRLGGDEFPCAMSNVTPAQRNIGSTIFGAT